MKTKICAKCEKRKRLNQFSKCKSRYDGLHVVCKKCDAHRLKLWRKENPNAGREWFAAHPEYKKLRLKKDPLMHRRHHLEYAYGITLDDYDVLFESQGKRCAICRRKKFQPVVDHNHKTGKVRGILCYCCNSALGFLSESPSIFKAALGYLKRHS